MSPITHALTTITIVFLLGVRGAIVVTGVHGAHTGIFFWFHRWSLVMCTVFALFWLFGTIIPYAANHQFGADDHSVYAPLPIEQDSAFDVVIGLISGSSVFNHTGMFIGVS